jgi:hypothetical protein
VIRKDDVVKYLALVNEIRAEDSAFADEMDAYNHQQSIRILAIAEKTEALRKEADRIKSESAYRIHVAKIDDQCMLVLPQDQVLSLRSVGEVRLGIKLVRGEVIEEARDEVDQGETGGW